MSQLHARSCRIGAEILHLIRGGFADGALARWRTLHEISVVANVISAGGPDLATRYLEHAEAQLHRKGLKYQEHRKALKLRPLGRGLVARNEARLRVLQAKYGEEFSRDWGWAAALLGGKGRPTFEKLEAKAKLAHVRPYFQWASDRVHAGASGLRPIGLEAEHGRTVMLAGATNVGLSDPGQNTAISVAQITASLGVHRPSMDFIVETTAVVAIALRCLEDFTNAHQAVEAQRPKRAVARNRQPGARAKQPTKA